MPGRSAAGPSSRPVEDPAAIDDSFLIGVDHSPTPSPDRLSCRDYEGRTFPHCYAGHEGTDFLLAGGFAAMDAGSASMVAAAPGIVVKIEDGHYDRCHARPEVGDVSCDGFPMKSNHVVVDHGAWGGAPLRTEYHHMMRGSMTVAVGQAVECGQRLGRIGSSGRSSVPHVHLNVLVGGAARRSLRRAGRQARHPVGGAAPRPRRGAAPRCGGGRGMM